MSICMIWLLYDVVIRAVLLPGTYVLYVVLFIGVCVDGEYYSLLQQAPYHALSTQLD